MMGFKVALVLLSTFCAIFQEGECVPIQLGNTTKGLVSSPDLPNNSTNEIISDKMAASLVDDDNDVTGGHAATFPKNVDSNGTMQPSRKGRVMNFNFDFPSLLNSKLSKTPAPRLASKFKAIQSRILTGSGTSLDVLASNSFQDNSFLGGGSLIRDSYGHPTPSALVVDSPMTNKYDAMLIGQSPGVKSVPPTDRFAALSYVNPASHASVPSLGGDASQLLAYYPDHFSKFGNPYVRDPFMYQMFPVTPTPPQTFRPSFTETVKDTLFKIKDSVAGTAEKVKNVLGFSGFSEKVASPDTLLAVAPVAAGLLAGSLAVAYFASRQGRGNSTSPLSIFGKRAVRDIISEEDLNQIVSRLDPVQREYLQKLQFYGPQRWKDVNCAKFIFCDVMSKATPLHVLDMQRKIGIFLSRMDESTARYVEVILKDVMLAIQARDCSRFSCGQSSWGLPRPPLPPPPFPPQFIGQIPFPGSNFLRRQ